VSKTGSFSLPGAAYSAEDAHFATSKLFIIANKPLDDGSASNSTHLVTYDSTVNPPKLQSDVPCDYCGYPNPTSFSPDGTKMLSVKLTSVRITSVADPTKFYSIVPGFTTVDGAFFNDSLFVVGGTPNSMTKDNVLELNVYDANTGQMLNSKLFSEYKDILQTFPFIHTTASSVILNINPTVWQVDPTTLTAKGDDDNGVVQICTQSGCICRSAIPVVWSWMSAAPSI
jgi:hypothetical protein